MTSNENGARRDASNIDGQAFMAERAEASESIRSATAGEREHKIRDQRSEVRCQSEHATASVPLANAFGVGRIAWSNGGFKSAQWDG